VPLLSSFVGGYMEAFDKEPLPVANRAYQRLLDLIASLDLRASAEDRLAGLNRFAAWDAQGQCSGAVSRSTKAHHATVASAADGKADCVR